MNKLEDKAIPFFRIDSLALRKGSLKGLTEMDIYIYSILKTFVNNKTNECYPGMDVIARKGGVSKETVRKSINNLKKAELIEVTKHPVYRSNNYRFAKPIKFEDFFLDFLLNNSTLTKHEKAFLIMMRQYIYKDTEACYLSMRELSDLLGLSYSTVRKRIASLKEKNYIKESFVFTYGKPRNKYMFDYREIAVRVANIEHDLAEHKKETSEELERMKAELKKLKEEIKELNEIRTQVKN